MSTSREPTIWMNVTTSVGWTRPPVGIVRVERALAEHLQTLYGPERFKLCVWRDNRFVEWVDMTSSPGSARLGKALDVILPRTASFDLARPFVMRALARFAEGGGRRADAPMLELKIPDSETPRLHPARGDVVISAGLDWDNHYTERFHGMARAQGLRIVTCCYDLIPVLFPQYCVGEVAQKFTEYFMQLCWGSEAVLCISRQTESDFTRLCADLGAPVRRTAVIPLGDSVPGAGGAIGDQVRQLTARPFILFVSTIERRKNHEVLYRAYHWLARRGHADSLPQLVFVGMPGWGVGDLMKDIELDPLVRGLIVQLHHVSDSELNHLYQHAQFCVYPSLYEGWGLPVGEALAMGKAVLSSDTGSLPEVGGELVRYLDPWNVAAWAEAILEWVREPQRVRKVERTVRQQYTPRQWLDTARAVKALIDDMPAPQEPLHLTLAPGHDMSTQAGAHAGTLIVARRTAGLLLFGPHWMLNAGSYEARITGAAGECPTAQNLALDIASEAGQRVHASEQVTVSPQPGSRQLAALRFTLDRDAFDVELRCVVGEEATVRIERLEFVALTPRARTPAAAAVSGASGHTA